VSVYDPLKVDFTLEEAIKAQRVNRCVAVLLNLSVRRGYMVNAPAALPPGKTRYPLNRRLGGPQGRSGQVRSLRDSISGSSSP